MTGKSESFVCCGDWQLVREIGRGAYGVVYLAAGDDGSWAAVKVCRRDDVGVERYERELRGAKLYRAIPPQEGLARMLDLVEETWGFYAVMELADDEFERESLEVDSYRPKTLACVIEGEKALPLDECVKLGISLTKGLVALQRHHLLHRDIKPGNVIYVLGNPVLSDPGLVVDESEAVSLVGTPGYVPPENFSAASGDVYGLGLTLKAASFGRCVEDLGKGPAPEADTGAKFFNAWWRVLNKATDPTPSRRYQSAKALLKDIERLSLKIACASVFPPRIVKAATALAAIVVVAVAVNSIVSGRVSGLYGVWNDASARFGDCGGVASTMAEIWSITHLTYVGNNPNLRAAKNEFSDIIEKSRGHASRFLELRKVAEEKYKNGQDITGETEAVKAIIADEDVLKKRVLEIMRSIYGKDWEPSPMEKHSFGL